MTEKEKIEEAKILYQTATNADVKSMLEILFPELKESEDEKIRKALVQAVWGTLKGRKLFGTNITREDALAWLEKQGEQKHTWSIEDEQNLNAALSYIDDEYIRRWLKDAIYNKYKKPVWSEEDERIYQSIINDTVQENQLDSKQIDWLKSMKSRVKPNQEWRNNNE